MSEIVLVGNSPSVLENSIGSKIDSVERVVRFNNYVVNEEFSEFVGTREDIWCMNATRKIERREYSGEIWIPQNLRNKNNLKRFLEIATVYDHITFLSQGFCENLDKTILGLPPNKWSTTGTYALQWAVENFDTIWTTGFGFFDGAQAGAISPHYFSHKLDEKIGSSHSIPKEKAYYKSLLLKGAIKELV